MGYKNVCLNCKRVESVGSDFTKFRTGDCPECSAPMCFVSQKFRPPKKNDTKSWDVAVLLISNGFTYYTICDDKGMPVPYPTSIDDAKRFINTYRANAAERNTRRKHDLEKQISELASLSPNEQRTLLIRKLQHELSKLTHDVPKQMNAG
ncbi:MAG: hypothetical protein HKN13_11370 [Rhodothermales bacterium]|nr:hypothetical protein [Rhodothermales bacterium]